MTQDDTRHWIEHPWTVVTIVTDGTRSSRWWVSWGIWTWSTFISLLVLHGWSQISCEDQASSAFWQLFSSPANLLRLFNFQTLGIWGVSKPSKPGSVRHLPQSHSDCHFRALSSKVNLWDVRPVNFLNLKSAMVRRQPFWRRGQRPAPEVPCYFLETTFPYFSNFGTYSLRTSQGESIVVYMNSFFSAMISTLFFVRSIMSPLGPKSAWNSVSQDMTHELLAWSTTEGCRDSLVVNAAQKLWTEPGRFWFGDANVSAG